MKTLPALPLDSPHETHSTRLSVSVHPLRFFAALALFAFPTTLHAALPTDEAGAIAYLTGKGLTITKNTEGRAVTLKSSGRPPMTAEEYALIGKLTQLEDVNFNASPLGDGEWGFLKALPKLKSLAIGHSGNFSTMEPFSGLPLESILVGGCVGLRDLNRGDKDKLRHAVKTLHRLPNLKSLSLYHSPIVVDDAHLSHIAEQFPLLETLRIDFAPLAGLQVAITPAGLAALQTLPLTTLKVEGLKDFTAAHFQAIAGIKSLKTLSVDTRRQPVNEDAIAAFKQARPDVEIVASQPGDKTAPQVKKK